MGVMIPVMDDLKVEEVFMRELQKLSEIRGFGLNEVSVCAQMLYSVITNKVIESQSKKRLLKWRG